MTVHHLRLRQGARIELGHLEGHQLGCPLVTPVGNSRPSRHKEEENQQAGLLEAMLPGPSVPPGQCFGRQAARNRGAKPAVLRSRPSQYAGSHTAKGQCKHLGCGLCTAENSKRGMKSPSTCRPPSTGPAAHKEECPTPSPHTLFSGPKESGEGGLYRWTYRRTPSKTSGEPKGVAVLL